MSADSTSLPQVDDSQFPVFNLVPVPLILTRLSDGTFIEINDACIRLLDRARPEVIGKKGTEIGIFPTQEMRDRFVEVVQTRNVFRDQELTVVRPDGTKRVVLLSMARVIHRGQECILKSLTDITERRDAEVRLSRLNAELESRVAERTAELESFSYSISHDLRAPLRHLSGFVGLLHASLERRSGSRPEADLTDTETEYLTYIGESAARMDQLVTELLAFSKIGRKDITMQRVEPAEVVRRTIEELAEEIGGRNIEWKIDPLPFVTADLQLFRSAIANLVGNAVKFTAGRNPARIHVGNEMTGDEIVFFVKDNGVGFDMKYVDKMFNVFQRLHTVEEFPGIGIGLANVRRIAERHGGRVWAAGAPGRGATFYLSWPSADG